MNDGSIPAHYQSLKARYPEVMAALEALAAAAAILTRWLVGSSSGPWARAAAPSASSAAMTSG